MQSKIVENWVLTKVDFSVRGFLFYRRVAEYAEISSKARWVFGDEGSKAEGFCSQVRLILPQSTRGSAKIGLQARKILLQRR